MTFEKNTPARFLYCALATIALILLDQATKLLAGIYLAGKGTVQVLGSYAILVFIKNRGAFLSVGHELGVAFWAAFFIIIPIAVLGALSYYVIRKKVTDRTYLALWVLVLSGGLGNLVDRIREGQVTDFMNIGIGNFRTGIFNVADLYIVIFVIILAFKLLLTTKEKKPD